MVVLRNFDEYYATADLKILQLNVHELLGTNKTETKKTNFKSIDSSSNVKDLQRGY